LGTQNSSSDQTIDTLSGEHEFERSAEPRVLLAVAWCADEPGRVGELLGDPAVRPGRVSVFGRGTEGLAGNRIGLWEPAAEGNRARPPSTCAKLSREQLALSWAPGRLTVQNVGKREMMFGGVPVARVDLRPGDLLEIRGLFLFIAVSRPPVFTGPLCTTAYGLPDEDGIVGESVAAGELRRRLEFVSARTGHVLVRGASGTGKELVAAALHRRGSRGPWVTRNAATIPEGLVDAELFGNVRNYPNAGMNERPGLVGAANGGTLFLDEFGELPPVAQAHLLRVMDSGEYQRLGDARPLRSSFRMIAATNRDDSALKEDVRARFPFVIELPPLNARREDIPLLVNHWFANLYRQDPELAQRFAIEGPRGPAPRIACALMQQMLRHEWSTHIRELGTWLWRSIADATGDQLDALAEPPVSQPPPTTPGSSPDIAEWVGKDPLGIPAAVIQAALDQCNGRQEQAWRVLGLDSRYVLGRLIRRHHLVVRKEG
jgi:two-component system nitrogen regulation response regulator GlnG/two-component system response regulator HydG